MKEVDDLVENEKGGKEGKKGEFESSLEEASSDSDQIESDMGKSADASRDTLCNNEQESSSYDAIFHKYHKRVFAG